ncbi:MAG: LLM class flavin-dependent oxidoreductase [Actinobacteria bacterium]|nr:LLM class flavin-dependent oxidoreductase [Actinomycetota bacterium]
MSDPVPNPVATTDDSHADDMPADDTRADDTPADDMIPAASPDASHTANPDAGPMARSAGAPLSGPIGTTLASLMSLPPAVWRETAALADDLGFDSLWTAETTGPEAFSSLAALGANHPRLSLGTGVLALQLRTPMLAAMGATTLATLNPGIDVMLGVGISSPVVVGRWHGAAYGKRPLAQVREYLTLVNECLSGEVVNFDGDYYSIKKSRLFLDAGGRRPQVVLGALNAKMLKLGGELADGVLLNYLPASAVPWCVEQVRRGEAEAGRAPGSCTIYAYVHVGVTHPEAAIVPGQRDLFSYIVVDSYAKAFARAGFEAEVDAVRAAHRAGDRAAALEAVSSEMIAAIDICGDAAHVAAAVQAYRDAGVDYPVIMPLPWSLDRSLNKMPLVEATLRAAIGA